MKKRNGVLILVIIFGGCALFVLSILLFMRNSRESIMKVLTNKNSENTRVILSETIVLSNPKPYEKIQTPFLVSGNRGVETSLPLIMNILLTDTVKNTLFEKNIQLSAHSFSEAVHYTTLPSTEMGVLTLKIVDENEPSARIAIRFADFRTAGSQKTVTLFFTKEDPDDTCGKIISVTRIEQIVPKPELLALGRLLQGPTRNESQLGFSTALPAYLSFPQIEKNSDEVRIIFSDATLKESPCFKTAETQIQKTLRLADPSFKTISIISPDEN